MMTASSSSLSLSLGYGELNQVLKAYQNNHHHSTPSKKRNDYVVESKKSHVHSDHSDQDGDAMETNVEDGGGGLDALDSQCFIDESNPLMRDRQWSASRARSRKEVTVPAIGWGWAV